MTESEPSSSKMDVDTSSDKSPDPSTGTEDDGLSSNQSSSSSMPMQVVSGDDPLTQMAQARDRAIAEEKAKEDEKPSSILKAHLNGNPLSSNTGDPGSDKSPSNDSYTLDGGTEDGEEEKSENKTNGGPGNPPVTLASGDDLVGEESDSKSPPTRTAKIGFHENGDMMPGFEDVVDEFLSFTSDSDFTIFNRQISSDIPLQRLVAVKRLGSSCPRFGHEAAFSLISRIRNVATDKEMVIRQTCAEQLGLYGKYLVESTQNSQRAHDLIINDLLPLIKDMLRDAMEVRQAAGTSLMLCAELLSKDEVYEHVLKIVLHMAHDDTDDQKISALPLLGELAPIVGSAVCKNYLSSDLHALSQDNSFRVRKATVQYFGPICEQLGADDAEKTLLPIFKQLCTDSIWSVRKGCVESFVNVASSVNQDTRASLIPIMEKFLTDTSRWVRNTAYEQLGPFIATLTSEQVEEKFLKYFANIPHLSSAQADADCTNHCAFNFPAVALTLGPSRWDELNDTYNILVRKTFKSRKTLASSIHEIARILGTEMTEKYLMSAIEFFLKDIDDIREGILRNFHKILQVLSMPKRADHLTTLWELGSESDVNWRFRLLLAEQLDEIAPLYDPSQVSQQIVPLAFQLCDDRMADVRYSAVVAVSEIIDYLSGQGEAAQDYLNEVIEKCDQIHSARTYSKRLLYVKMCAACIDKIDPNIFERSFLPKVLTYSEDRISNVRFALARFVVKYLRDSPFWSTKKIVKECIGKLRQDPEDVEVRRFFSTEEEIEAFLLELKEKREAQENGTGGTGGNDVDGGEIGESDLNGLSGTGDVSGLGLGLNGNGMNGSGIGEAGALNNGLGGVKGESEGEDDDEGSEDDDEDEESSEGSYSSSGDDTEDSDDGGTDKGLGGTSGRRPLDEKEAMKLNAFDVGSDLIQKKVSDEDKEAALRNKLTYQEAKESGGDYDNKLYHQPTPFRLPGLGGNGDDDGDDSSSDENDGDEKKTEKKENESQTENQSDESNAIVDKDGDVEIPDASGSEEALVDADGDVSMDIGSNEDSVSSAATTGSSSVMEEIS